MQHNVACKCTYLYIRVCTMNIHTYEQWKPIVCVELIGLDVAMRSRQCSRRHQYAFTPKWLWYIVQRSKVLVRLPKKTLSYYANIKLNQFAWCSAVTIFMTQQLCGNSYCNVLGNVYWIRHSIYYPTLISRLFCLYRVTCSSVISAFNKLQLIKECYALQQFYFLLHFGVVFQLFESIFVTFYAFHIAMFLA